MIEVETANALREAIEQLDAAMHLLAGLRAPSIRDDTPYAVRGALVVVHQSVQHANALLHSVLDKGR